MSSLSRLFRGGTSVTAIVLAATQVAYAQDAVAPAVSDDASAEDIIVTGVRASLDSAQEVKRNSDQIVDSIQAEDIGKLPDVNTVEALQRITGIQIQRRYGEGGTDVDHRTQSAIAIRGLTQVRTQIDGRDSYSAAGGRNFDIEALPPELLAGIDVYKNPSADVIEGGIGGVVNLRTRLPFDQKGQVINVTARASYYDLAEKWGGSVSGLYSNRWDTGAGEMGLLLNAVYSKGKYRQDAILIQSFFNIQPGTFPGAPTAPQDPVAPTGARAPAGVQIYDELGSRERLTLAGAFQWQMSSNLKLTLQALHSDYKFLREGRYFYNLNRTESPTPTPGATFTYADDGRMLSGSFNNMLFESFRGDQDLSAKNTNLAGRLEWQATDTLSVSFDGQYLKSSYDVDAYSFIISQFRDFGEPQSASPNRNIVDFDISGRPTWTVRSPELLTDPNRYRFAYLQESVTRNDTDQLALRYDVKWEPVDSVVEAVNIGMRFSEADIAIRSYSPGFCTFDTGNFASCSAPAGSALVPYSDALREFIYDGPAKGFFEGRSVDGVLYPTAPGKTVNDRIDAAYAAFGAERQNGFLPQDLNHQYERTLTSHLSANFDLDRLGIPLDGTVGLRLVQTKVRSEGILTTTSGVTPISVGQTYVDALPSINLRAHFTDNLQLRLAFGKALARPDFTQMSTNTTLGPANLVNPATGRPSGSSGNPFLKPIRSTQFDASLEWYFARAGSLTASAFYKDVKGFLTSGTVVRNFSGVDYDIGTVVNANDGKIKGFEVAYQQFFDFLPGVLSGLGVQANYTYVDSSVQNPFATPGSTIPTLVPLEKLSKHSYNLVGLYEKGPISARVAWSWRDKYLDTTVGSGANGQPQIQAPYASLDASISYNLNDNIAISIDAVNLNNRMNKTYIGRETEPLQYTLNDRRFGFSIRATY
ncbi:TonB-dependent receptor [Sphingopyxis sp. NJF-3]